MAPEVDRKIVKTTCGQCNAGCGMRVHLEKNRIVHLEGDPESPVNQGLLCPMGLASLDYLDHPQRLRYPLKKKGDKGSGRWERVSWEEALDLTAEALQNVKTDSGPESAVFIRGSFKGRYQGAYLARLANAFGSPNIASMASVCYMPRVSGSMITHGFNPVPDYEFPPACIVVWGANMAATRIAEHKKTIQAVQSGARLMIIDPRQLDLSVKADIHLQPRPGSDLALALGLLNVIVEEKLYDREFVDRWTVGFDKLESHLKDYPPAFAEQATWVKADAVRQAARLYAAHRPAVIQAGNAIDHNGNNFQTARALAILRALTGNLGRPGGELSCSPPGVLSPLGAPELDLRKLIPDEVRGKRLSASEGLMPHVFYTLPQNIVKAVLEGRPYPLRAGFIQGGNMLLTYTNARRVYEAFRKLEFLAVADMFMSPTAALADVVFPAAGFLECDSIVAPPYYPVAQVQQKVAHVDGCYSDFDIISGLAQRLDLGKHFWESELDSLDDILKPAGLTFAEFRKVGVLEGKKEYRKHEKDGFATPSKKVELFSERLAEWGFDPLPAYRELAETPFSEPALEAEYPFVLTSWKSGLFRHSSGRQISRLREAHPEPVVWLHPEAAQAHGITDNDWVFVETRRGQIRQKARLTSRIDPRVAGVDYGWWFPEKDAEGMYGWDESNINMLTDDAAPYGRELGTPTLRGFACKIYKV